MKFVVILLALSFWFTACNRCGECIPKEPKLSFICLTSDTLLHPISSIDSLRVFTYYQDALWDKTGIKDTTYKIKINWYKVKVNGTDSFYYAFDIGYQISRNKSIEWNDYWLKGTNNAIQIKLSKITLDHSEVGGGPCDCPGAWFTNFTTINDSLNLNHQPILLW
jgi:hypothetical protein